MLEPPRRGGSNKYPQSMFLSKNKKNRYTPTNPIFFYIKVGFKWVYISGTCFPDESHKVRCYATKQNKQTGNYLKLVYPFFSPAMHQCHFVDIFMLQLMSPLCDTG